MTDARQLQVKLRDDPAVCLPDGWTRPFRIRLRPARAQRGGVLIMFALTCLLIFGIFGLTLDLGRLYNRRIDMQTVADAVALAAARELNGTPQGLANALVKAGNAAEKIKYGFDHSPIAWSESAISFSEKPGTGATWLDAGSAADSANLNRLLYVKVDTNDLPTPHGTINTTFIRVLPNTPTTASANGRATAGPSMINVTPFAICAMSSFEKEPLAHPASAGPPAVAAVNELIEYGFRRGVSYDLMRLPNASAPQNFLVNPVASPGTMGSAAEITDAAVGPFVCTGTMAMPQVTDSNSRPITVASPFPLSTLFDRFNSRFDNFTTGNCDPWTAPPDTNIQSFDRSVAANVPWMNPRPVSQVGLLWSFAKAVPWSSYTSGASEPTAGYVTFTTTNWRSLQYPGSPGPLGTYNNGTASPYTTIVTLPAPARRPGLRNRRVLNVPLLACPVSGSTATVRAIGKFFMTMPATGGQLHAEFAGLASESALATRVEFHP
jgi:Flp pilus assembly protein TadG